MIVVPNSEPMVPTLVIVNVPPLSSSRTNLAGPGAGGHVGKSTGQTGEVQISTFVVTGSRRP